MLGRSTLDIHMKVGFLGDTYARINILSNLSAARRATALYEGATMRRRRLTEKEIKGVTILNVDASQNAKLTVVMVNSTEVA